MKHILNNLTEAEKNAIREQHSGGMKLQNEKFKLMVEKKLGDVKPLVDEQVLQGIKDFVNKGINMVTGKTGNKFFDAVIGAKLGKMQDGNSSNEKLFCMDDSCEESLRVFSNGRVVYELAEFDTKTKGNIVLNSDGSFIIKFDDGTSSKKFMSK
jgi:hypothetical protein